MQEADTTSGSSATGSSKASLPKRKQPFPAIIIAAAVFAAVMCLILLAVRQSPSEVGEKPETQNEGVPDHEVSPNITVEDVSSSLRTMASGVREIAVRGYVRNKGKLAAKTADLRCYFETRAGGETHFDFPLITDSELDELGGGPLMSLARKEFSVRIGEFPDTVVPEITHSEVVNVRLLNP